MREAETVYICEHIGIAGTTLVHFRKNEDGTIEARCGIAVMGTTQMDEAGFAACGNNPFHKNFYDNYAYGVGETEEEAVEALKKDMNSHADSLWMF